LLIIPRLHLETIDEEFKEVVLNMLEPMGYTPYLWNKKFKKGHPVISFRMTGSQPESETSRYIS